MTLALIDGDGIVYRCAASVEKTRYLVTLQGEDRDPIYCDSWQDARKEVGGIIWSRKEIGSIEDAKARLDLAMARILEFTKASAYTFVLSDPGSNFRDSVAKTRKYKGNRDSTSRPYHFGDLRAHVMGTFHSIQAVGEEADDYISYTSRVGKDDVVIVGNDKDLDQIPGKHYNWVTGEEYSVSQEEARTMLWMQVLMGDVGDNVPGCWRMGFNRAKERVTEWLNKGYSDKELWAKVIEEYEISQRLKDCPYVEGGRARAQEVAEETYWLVKLRTHPEESPNVWTRKQIVPFEERAPEKRVINGEKEKESKESQDQGKYPCVPNAKEGEGGSTEGVCA